ncbi:response regulator transcription factor [Ramlibacter humi]|uniref:Response regulator transcription factor n=1 Tax=Ramlibacter humi TaxID=2530451 RepID=A0A4Z0BGI7_9BURK|nr:response regulator transcription factor [Ramlibacter humi]TFY97018.1 response regulator transcription factor [Ramlibacter humi]
MRSTHASSPHAGPAVLAVDDDRETTQVLTEFLHDFGMDVEVAGTGAQMKSCLQRRPFDLVLLDLTLPDEPGMELCSWTKERAPELPVIMLTAADDPDTCIEGLARGADDYVSKPFQARELVARIKAILRRTSQAVVRGAASAFCRHDAKMRQLTIGTLNVTLTEHENRIIGAFIDHPGAALSRARLLEMVHAPGVDLADRSIDAAISNIRSKLGQHRDLIRTVRGEGYFLEQGRG